MKIKSIKQCKNLKDKTVLVRCDFDVPLKNKKVADNSRLKACLPTIEFLLNKKVKQIILIGHLGRPAGKVVPSLSLEPVKKEMEKLLKKKIEFIKTGNFSHGVPRLASAHSGLAAITMLDNLRFNPGEQKNDKKFAKQLASLADIYVNEAFAVSHRSASSVDAIQDFLPSYAGLNLEQEILNLSAVLSKPRRPLTLIIGGAKIETKLPVIKNFINSADNILIGGGVANTFLKAQGMDVKNSLIDSQYLPIAEKLLKNLKVLLPIDVKWFGSKIYDIGPKTIQEFSVIIKKSRTILWNGPMGYFEDKKFRTGTEKIARAVLKNRQVKVIIGGGETSESLKHLSTKTLKHKNIFISTGGGAMLEFLSGKKMPGLRKILK